MMASFFKHALSAAKHSDNFSEPQCSTVALASFKRLMTELDSSVEAWPHERQPVPSELFCNLLNGLEFERSIESNRHLRLHPSDAFKLTTRLRHKCPNCGTESKPESSSTYVLELYTNGRKDVEKMLDRKFG